MSAPTLEERMVAAAYQGAYDAHAEHLAARPADDDLMTPEQTAERLRVSVDTVRRALRSGDLPSIRVGLQYRVSRARLDAMTAVTAAGPPPPTPPGPAAVTGATGS